MTSKMVPCREKQRAAPLLFGSNRQQVLRASSADRAAQTGKGDCRQPPSHTTDGFSGYAQKSIYTKLYFMKDIFLRKTFF